MNGKILITGGAGCLGSNLIEHYFPQGFAIKVIDNFATGKRENIEEFLEDPNFVLIEGDIRKLEDCLKATKNIDYVLSAKKIPGIPAIAEWLEVGVGESFINKYKQKYDLA